MSRLPGWGRAVVVGSLFFSAAALIAENHPPNKNNNPPAKAQPAKAQPAQAAHRPQASGHAAPSTAAGHGPQASGHATPTTGSHPSPTTGSASGAHGYTTGTHGAQQYHSAQGGPHSPAGARPGYSASHTSAGYGGAHGGSGHMVVRSANTTVYRGPGGERRIVHNLPGGRIAVANGRGHGYVQRSVMVRGHSFVQRTYYVGGRPQARFYRPYFYHGISFNVYAPLRFWSPGFYAWAYSPWAAPIYYNWGWAGNPWYGYYGGYFAPYPSYASPNLWLTDYLLANSLQEAYQERMDAAAAASAPAPAAAPAGQVTLTPDVKQLIADEIRQQLAQESTESQAAQVPEAQAPQAAAPSPEPVSTAPPALSPNKQHIFIVSSVVVVSANGEQCAITQGDVLQLDPADPYPDPTNAKVLASKTADCQSGKAVQVGLADLQEMQNHMREMLDKGLGDLQSKQGQGNIPVIEASLRTSTPAPYAADLPAADPNVASELQQTAQAGTAAASAAPAPAPVKIDLGQTVDQVVAKLGQPVKKFDGTQKTIYFYKDLKITFTSGKVSDVQ